MNFYGPVPFYNNMHKDEPQCFKRHQIDLRSQDEENLFERA